MNNVWHTFMSPILSLVAVVHITYYSSHHPASCLQLADQNIEDFMAKRGFNAMPKHEDIWVVPVSQVPAAYNLHARMQAAADTAREDIDEEAESAMDRPDEEPSSPRSKQPRKPKQQVPICLHGPVMIHGRYAWLFHLVACFCRNTLCLPFCQVGSGKHCCMAGHTANRCLCGQHPAATVKLSSSNRAAGAQACIGMLYYVRSGRGKSPPNPLSLPPTGHLLVSPILVPPSSNPLFWPPALPLHPLHCPHPLVPHCSMIYLPL